MTLGEGFPCKGTKMCSLLTLRSRDYLDQECCGHHQSLGTAQVPIYKRPVQRINQTPTEWIQYGYRYGRRNMPLPRSLPEQC